ncbi:MAG: hypothetical protein L6R41_006618 [Letrouitia leprolyta]|nr:MAG: hypothetical protein L6R41_006618 [Letrouitia leprolyta]
MEAEEDDDIYAPSEVIRVPPSQDANGQKPADLEEGEQEDEDEEEESDSDIDIITERKEEPKSESVVAPTRVNAIKTPAGRAPSISADLGSKPRSPAIKSENASKLVSTPAKPGASYPAVRTSSIDVDAKPVHGPTGKLITEVDMDADFSEDDKPWRRPGTDMSDYFNYGFDEFTWASYCLKQENLRKEVADTKKQMEEMQNFMNMPGGMPPMPGMPASSGTQGGMPPMPGMEGIPPEVQQMLQTMISQGMDPTQVSPEMMMQMMSGQGGGNQSQGQNFGADGGQNFGQRGQNQGYGYGGGGGGGGGRGRGGGRRW